MTRRDPSEEGARTASVEAGVVRAVGSVGLATLASRILGFVRDVVIAHAFGAGLITDAFFVAFRIPNLFRRLLAEGALATAFVPVFTEYLATRPRDEFDRMVRAVVASLVLVLCLVSALGVLLAPWIVRVMAPGFADAPDQLRLATTLTRLMFPYLILVGLAALAMGVLNTHRRFFTAALGPAVLNVGMITAALVLAPSLEIPVLALAAGVLVGGLGQFAIQLPELRRVGASLRPSSELFHPVLWRIARLLGPAVVGLAGVQLNVFVTTLLASLLAVGSISFLYYADRVVQFPLGVFGIALATAALPPMAEQAARRDLRALCDTLNFGLRLSCFVAIPASAGLWLLREPIVRVLFERGQFGPEETQATAWALALYALGLTAFSGVRIVAQPFYALGEPATPVRVGLLGVGLNVVFSLVLMGPLAHGGLALAVSTSATVNFLLLLWLLRRRLGPLGGRRIAWSLARTGGGTLAMSAWCSFVLWNWPLSATRWAEAGWLVLAIGGGIAAFGTTTLALRGEEGPALLALGRRRGAKLPTGVGD